MDSNFILSVHSWLLNIANRPNSINTFVSELDFINTREKMLLVAKSIEKEAPMYSGILLYIRDRLFNENVMGSQIIRTINPFAFGKAIAYLETLLEANNPQSNYPWNLIHPKIAQSSKQLYLDGHYSNAACDAFIEINDRVKKLFQKLRPGENVPDGDGAMKAVFSANSPLVEFCDRSTQTGQNIQKGYMEMLAGAMSALRNPKAHENTPITAEDAMRRLMFASMLMYKIDEAVVHSSIRE